MCLIDNTKVQKYTDICKYVVLKGYPVIYEIVAYM